MLLFGLTPCAKPLEFSKQGSNPFKVYAVHVFTANAA